MLNLFSLSALAILSLTNVQANTCSSLNNDPMYNDLLKELRAQNINCEGISTHLTFDDGPNEKTSGVILNELDKRNIKATFFITTTNLIPNKPGVGDREAILKRELKNGHTVASHGHEHNAYDLRITGTKEAGYSASEREKQINTSVTLLDRATGGQFSEQKYRLFRFPYGRGAAPSQKEIADMELNKKMVFKGSTYAEKLKEYRRMSPALQQIAGHDFSHLGWNHDSNDSSLPFKMPSEDVFRKYVKANMEELCSPGKPVKVSLFHDIKEVNTRAIPLIADLGSCLGLKFLTPKEMVNSSSLTNTDVLIKNNQLKKAPVEMVDEISNLLKSVNAPAKQCPDVAKNDSPVGEGCYSTYLKKTFKNCEGETSKCYEGKWYGANDPTILLNCSL
ncbi:polysaccharide deacetylase family protein [Bacteriovorax sp. PP10]|uniref:Polysaccharide deacetylase family protein n=1 Tax=Bacteriovorax antarcticus TaxID=3088717 RepID=A0ABU5W1P3_9BACT|nr:polysaccharide deacetylase family protein [Bacteriovorax sp. PP10]MEA9358175.1 polysaccharide deacetylase family protein [Bacteriovorax sp. PP10]